MADQQFGGWWSLIKTAAVEEYLRLFTRALKNQPFQLVYIDAFAGTGTFAFAEAELPLLGEPETFTARHGSALRAATLPEPFHQMIFADLAGEKLAALEAALPPDARSRAQFEPGPADVTIPKLCRGRDWRTWRGVVFLDPFGMSVSWDTLRRIADTKALDVWYLFPIGGLLRQAPHDPTALSQDKRDALTRLLGTTAWEQKFYDPPREEALDLFGKKSKSPATRTVTAPVAEAFVRERLLKTFPYVASPVLRLGRGGRHSFTLFFAIANASDKAIALAERLAGAIIAKHSQTS